MLSDAACRVRASPQWLMAAGQLFCAAGLIAGVAVATIALIRPGDWAPKYSSLVDDLAGAGGQLATPPVTLALGIAALSLWFAFRDRLRLFTRL